MGHKKKGSRQGVETLSGGGGPDFEIKTQLKEAATYFNKVIELTNTTGVHANQHICLRALLHLAVLKDTRGEEEVALDFLHQHLKNVFKFCALSESPPKNTNFQGCVLHVAR